MTVHLVVKHVNEWTMGENGKIALFLVHLSHVFCHKFAIISQLHNRRLRGNKEGRKGKKVTLYLFYNTRRTWIKEQSWLFFSLSCCKSLVLVHDIALGRERKCWWLVYKKEEGETAEKQWMFFSARFLVESQIPFSFFFPTTRQSLLSNRDQGGFENVDAGKDLVVCPKCFLAVVLRPCASWHEDAESVHVCHWSAFFNGTRGLVCLPEYSHAAMP